MRHDGLQRGVQMALQFSQTTVLPIRGQNWFGSAGFVASSARPGSYRRGDLILPHYRAAGLHVIVDVAVGDPCGSVTLAAGSDVQGGVAAALVSRVVSIVSTTVCAIRLGRSLGPGSWSVLVHAVMTCRG